MLSTLDVTLQYIACLHRSVWSHPGSSLSIFLAHVKPLGIWLRPGLLAAYWVQLPLPWLKDFAKSGRSCDFLLQHLNGFIQLMLDELELSCKRSDMRGLIAGHNT